LQECASKSSGERTATYALRAAVYTNRVRTLMWLRLALLLLVAAHAVADSDWCDCGDEFDQIGHFSDLFANGFGASLSIYYNGVTYTLFATFIDNALLPMMPIQSLTGAHVAMQLLPTNCRLLVGGTLYTMSVNVDIVIGVITSAGTRMYKFTLNLNAACTSTVSRGKFVILKDGITVSPYDPASDDNMPVDTLPTLVPGGQSLDESNGWLFDMQTCSPTGASAQLAHCPDIRYARTVYETRVASSAAEFEFCMAVAVWTSKTPPADSTVLGQYEMTFNDVDFTYRTVQLVCGRSMTSVLVIPSIDSSPFEDKLNAMPKPSVTPESCENTDGYERRTHACSPYDVFLSAVFRPGSTDAQAKNSYDICPIPYSADCPLPSDHRPPAKWYTGALVIGLASLALVVAAIAATAYEATVLREPAEKFQTNALPPSRPVQPSTPRLIMPSTGSVHVGEIRQRQKSPGQPKPAAEDTTSKQSPPLIRKKPAPMSPPLTKKAPPSPPPPPLQPKRPPPMSPPLMKQQPPKPKPKPVPAPSKIREEPLLKPDSAHNVASADSSAASSAKRVYQKAAGAASMVNNSGVAHALASHAGTIKRAVHLVGDVVPEVAVAEKVVQKAAAAKSKLEHATPKALELVGGKLLPNIHKAGNIAVHVPPHDAYRF
jgi:hypothetical protein